MQKEELNHKYADFSVCTSVYKNDNPNYVAVALDSIINQTLCPKEIVLVVDGPVSNELNTLLSKYESDYPELFHVIRLKENKGLGNALNVALLASKHEIIARMDSDDIAASDRFEKQLKCFEIDSDLSIVGGGISEFIDSPDNIVGYRMCPLTDKDLKKYMKKRCGFNHMTVMFRKSEVLRVGSYQDWFWNEDYYLWIRMMLASCKFANLPDVLVNVRVGEDMYRRRGGWKYFKSEAKLQFYMWKKNVIGFVRLIYNVSIRFVVQVAMPNRLRGWLLRMFARN